MVLPIEVPQEDLPDTAISPSPGAEVPSQDLPVDYGSAGQMAKTALEQGLSGATLGASKVAEVKLGLTTPEAIKGREEANPVTSTLSNIGGTGAMLIGTGGIGALGEAGTIAGRIGLGALEGAGIGGANQVTDDWSQNKALDAQKIVASAGLGAALGALGSGVVEGIKAKYSPLIKKTSPLDAASEPVLSNPESVHIADTPVLDTPSIKETLKEAGSRGVQPTTYKEIADRVNAARNSGNAIELPAKNILEDALSRVEMKNPVNPLQLDSLGAQEARNLYQTAKELPGDIGQTISGYESIQKNELVDKTIKAIGNIAEDHIPISDAAEGGQKAIDAFTHQYQAEQTALKPIFNNLKKLPFKGDILPEAIQKMSDAVPGVSNMFKVVKNKLEVIPYRTLWGMDKSTYSAVKEAFDSLKDAPNDFQSIWNIRKGLDQHIDVLAQGKAPAEIRALKASLMDLMQSSAPEQNVRDAFKKYAINEQQRAVIEKVFGASVGSPEFGAISKVKPEMIGDKIFNNSATVQAAKKILPKEQFDQILSNWISEAQSSVTDKGTFSSNKFGSFLRKNQDALNVAFSDNPEKLQELTDLTTIMRILPDSPSINPSGTAKTLYRMLSGLDVHNLTWEGLAASIPKKVAEKIGHEIKLNQLDRALQGKSTQNTVSNVLQLKSKNTTDKIDTGIKALFSGSSSESRKLDFSNDR